MMRTTALCGLHMGSTQLHLVVCADFTMLRTYITYMLHLHLHLQHTTYNPHLHTYTYTVHVHRTPYAVRRTHTRRKHTRRKPNRNPLGYPIFGYACVASGEVARGPDETFRIVSIW